MDKRNTEFTCLGCELSWVIPTVDLQANESEPPTNQCPHCEEEYCSPCLEDHIKNVKEDKMDKYLFPIVELEAAIQDYFINPEDKRILLHLEAMLHELLDNVRREIIQRDYFKDIEIPLHRLLTKMRDKGMHINIDVLKNKGE